MNDNDFKLTSDKKKAIKFVLDELNKRGLIKPTTDITQKTKEVLKNYCKLKKAIQNYKKEIKRLNNAKNSIDGGPKFNSNSITYNKSKTTNMSSLDIIESRIRDLNMTIAKINCFINELEDVIKSLDKEDADLIEKVYFNKIDVDDIAIELNLDSSTLYKRIRKIINRIEIELFANDFIDNMLY